MRGPLMDAAAAGGGGLYAPPAAVRGEAGINDARKRIAMRAFRRRNSVNLNAPQFILSHVYIFNNLQRFELTLQSKIVKNQTSEVGHDV